MTGTVMATTFEENKLVGVTGGWMINTLSHSTRNKIQCNNARKCLTWGEGVEIDTEFTCCHNCILFVGSVVTRVEC